MDVFGDEFVLHVEDVLSHDICVDDTSVPPAYLVWLGYHAQELLDTDGRRRETRLPLELALAGCNS